MKTLLIYGIIGDIFDGITDRQVADELDGASGPLTVRINSPGGIADDGIAIYNLLRDYDGEVAVKVDGIAASAASVVAMAGDTIEMSTGSRMMIHNAWGMAIGDHRDMESYANRLRMLSANVAEIYAERAGGAASDFAAAMDAETWYNADTAIETGLATGKASRKSDDVSDESAKLFALMKVRNIPDDLSKATGEQVDAWRRKLAKRQLDLTLRKRLF